MSKQVFVLNAGHRDRARMLKDACDFLPKLPQDKSWRIEITKEVKARTSKQNRTLYGLAEATLADFCGYEGSVERKALHLYLCKEFFGRSPSDPLGLMPIRTTTKNEQGEQDVISTEVANGLFAFIQRLAAKQGCYIPDPDPLWGQQKRFAADAA